MRYIRYDIHGNRDIHLYAKYIEAAAAGIMISLIAGYIFSNMILNVYSFKVKTTASIGKNIKTTTISKRPASTKLQEFKIENTFDLKLPAEGIIALQLGVFTTDEGLIKLEALLKKYSIEYYTLKTGKYTYVLSGAEKSIDGAVKLKKKLQSFGIASYMLHFDKKYAERINAGLEGRIVRMCIQLSCSPYKEDIRAELVKQLKNYKVYKCNKEIYEAANNIANIKGSIDEKRIRVLLVKEFLAYNYLSKGIVR